MKGTRLWKCGQRRGARGGDQRNAAEFGVAFERVIHLRAVTDADAAVLETTLFAFTFLPIFEQCANGESHRPIVASNLGDAIAAARDEPRVSVSRAGGGDDAGNLRRRDTLQGENCRQSGVELPERSLGRETEIDRLRQTRGGVLDVNAGAEREAAIAPREGRLDIDRGELGAERRVSPNEVWLVIGFQSEGCENADAHRDVAVAAVPDEGVRSIQIADDMIDAGVASIATDNRQAIEWRSRQVVARALVGEFV